MPIDNIFDARVIKIYIIYNFRWDSSKIFVEFCLKIKNWGNHRDAKNNRNDDCHPMMFYFVNNIFHGAISPSRIILPDIFDLPFLLSSKIIGISLACAPAFTKKYLRQLRKAYP